MSVSSWNHSKSGCLGEVANGSRNFSLAQREDLGLFLVLHSYHTRSMLWLLLTSLELTRLFVFGLVC